MATKEVSDIQTKLVAIERLVELFKWERITYLIVTGLALAMLLIAVATLLLRHEADAAILVPLFGSSGLITYSLGRVLRMWDQAIHLISDKSSKVNSGDER
jgi:hypothetical protein